MTWQERVQKIAVTWLGTPFHDNACLKGIGVDCANLLYGVYREADVVAELLIPHYSPQWHMHQKEEKFLEFIRSYGKQISGPVPGATVLFRTFFEKPYSHGAIVLEWPTIVHASQPARIVELHDASKSALARVDAMFFEPKTIKLCPS